MDNTDRGNKPDQADSDPRPAAVTFVTTEHFTLGSGAARHRCSPAQKQGAHIKSHTRQQIDMGEITIR